MTTNDNSPPVIPDIEKKSNRDIDPQMTLTGILKSNDRTEMIVFTIPLLLVEITCIVPIPAEGTHTVPVYLKFRIKRP